MTKKRIQGMIAGTLIGVLLTGSVAFAKQASEVAELFYHDIKIYIDGGEIVPKDANENTVEPFTMNGTTYLPVRAIANAFGQDVEWDGTTQSVYIGKKDQTKPDNYLDRIQYNDYKEAQDNYNMTIINGTLEDYRGKIYTNGLMFWQYQAGIENEKDGAGVLVAYPLNSQYKNLKGTIVIPKKHHLADWGEENSNTAPCDVYFYGDGKLLYHAVYVTSSLPFSFDIDVSGVNQLQIKTKAEGAVHLALTDLALYK